MSEETYAEQLQALSVDELVADLVRIAERGDGIPKPMTDELARRMKQPGGFLGPDWA